MQCSLNGGDAYWGRVLSELGASGALIDPERVDIAYNGVTVCRDGIACAHDDAALAAAMAAPDIEIRCDLHLGARRGDGAHHRPVARVHRREPADVVSTSSAIRASGPRARRRIVLAEALPYIREFSGKTVVIKYGGHAMNDADARRPVRDRRRAHAARRHEPVVVHGGGPQITDLMRRLGKEPEFVDGRRVTDAETVDIVRMTLVGKVNREIVASVNRHGSYAVGLSGEDAGLDPRRPARPAARVRRRRPRDRPDDRRCGCCARS